MFHGRHPRAAVGHARGQPRVGHRRGRHRNVHHLGQVNAAKHNARIRRRGAKGQLHPLPAVQAHAHGAGEGFKGSLLNHELDFIVDQ